MDKQETAKILAVLAASYPRFEIDEVRVKVWYEMLKDYDYKAINHVVWEWIKEEAFPPSIAEIRKRVGNLSFDLGYGKFLDNDGAPGKFLPTITTIWVNPNGK